ncbi:DNA replication and repair protein RecF [Luteolibacter pohnpeiensis]|uniref:DNA replication and repair protein RecF n=1 Tax=Luteolibacter pohnpeiensis TaxID=454153 RepID=A0A934SB12_9BACT|nr:DNA replication and repair protein RecF [Luteolibacter pohnpeiensis]MBK1882609.1 DNA replication and repair protein RecF [Luteolibacter pohnpeiensis]
MLSSLRLLDFRCFASLDIEAPPAGAVLIGENAQGKTSILEAICMLVRLHSPRTHRMATLSRFGADQFGIAGTSWSQERRVRYSRDGFRLRVDEEKRPNQSTYLEDGGLVVWMGNEDLELIRGSGEIRRRYLDFLGAQLDPAYRRSWSRYRRALRAKNLLLKEGRTRDAEIASYEEILVEHGTVLMEIRARLVEGLSPFAAAAQLAISGKDEKLTLNYLPASGPDMRQSMLQAKERETRLRQAVVGPHRDDLELRINGMPAGDFASEGQQRTMALALKLAQGRLLEQRGGKLPIYLLDDIFGELDPLRRNALMNHLPTDAQKWITTTHLDWLRETQEISKLARLVISQGSAKTQ